MVQDVFGRDPAEDAPGIGCFELARVLLHQNWACDPIISVAEPARQRLPQGELRIRPILEVKQRKLGRSDRIIRHDAVIYTTQGNWDGFMSLALVRVSDISGHPQVSHDIMGDLSPYRRISTGK